MGEFGWAYISGAANSEGINGSVQLKDGSSFTGSSDLVFDASKNLKVTGSVIVKGRISASAEISASAYYGDGSNLSGISSVSIDNDGANRVLTADGDGTMTAQSNLTFDASTLTLTGTLNVSGTVNANAYNIDVTNKNVINLSATGSTKFGDTTDDIHQFTGSLLTKTDIGVGKASIAAETNAGKRTVVINGTAGGVVEFQGSNVRRARVYSHNQDLYLSASSNIILENISSGTATTSSYLALDSSNNIVLTSSAGGSGGTIGAAEDSDGYGDGLFTDFDASTAIGTPIDRFNEVLKILAPTPAPVVSSITSSVPLGVTAKLSFGSSKPVTDYTSSATAAGFDAVDATGIYSASVSGSNLRLGIYDGTQDITGEINHHVVESITNGYMAYSNDAFGNANEGTLKLELNGTVIHSVSLSGLAGSGNPNTGSANSLTNQSGFTNVSVTASSFDGNNSEWYIFKYRTAKFKVDTDQQKVGWNYARVIHTLTSDNETNYIEWINDPSGAVNDLSISNPRIEDVSLVGSKYLSGVQYNTDATAKYKAVINNLYRNIYQASGNPISFTATNSSNPASQTVEDIGGSENNTKALSVTGNLDFNGTTLFNTAMTCNMTVAHPLKNTITNTGSATTGNSFLIDNRTLGSTKLEEKFHDETYRKTSGSYDTQGSVTAAASNWNSQNHMTGGGATGHTDGLLFHNQRLYSPVDADIPNGGNFSGISNVASGQPNYSSIVGTRTFYRVVSNSSGVTKRDMVISSSKDSTRYNNSGLAANNVQFFAKIPGSTGWMDITQPFNYGSSSDGHGALVVGATSNNNTGSTDNGDARHVITFGTQSVANNEHIMIKVLADESWGGYINELSFSVGATSNTATESDALDNIDLDDTAGIGARLSFGTSNSLSDYSNAQGSGIGSMANYNINALYNDEGTTRRGVFKAFENMGGTLNEDINANGSNYPADSFKDSYRGALSIKVNGAEKHEVTLYDTIGSKTNDFNGNNTGFSVSALGFSTTTDGVPDYTKPYRTGTYQIGTSDQRVGWNYAQVLHNLDRTAVQTIIVTVVGGIFHFDGVQNTTLSLKVGNTYKFDVSHSSNGSHPLAFSTTSGGSHSGGSPYTTGVTSPSGFLQIIPEEAVTLYPYCTSHPGMGGTTQLNITTATIVQTNYVEWIVDPSGSVVDTNVSTPNFSNFNHSDIYYQSGIGYFASNPTASFTFTGSNYYRNVYDSTAQAIDFGTRIDCLITNLRITGSGVTTYNGALSLNRYRSLPNLNGTTGCETTSIQLTGTVQYNGITTAISGGLGLFTDETCSVGARIRHPLKNASGNSTGVHSKTNFMKYSGSLGSTNLTLNEYFNKEDYRIVSGNYASQSDVTSSGNSWNSQRSMNDGGSYPEYNDGMVTVSGYLISPLQIGNDGDTRNIGDGGSLQAPNGNPNYSTSQLSQSTRTFYRYFRNQTGLTYQNGLSLVIEGTANLVSKDSGYAKYAALGANNNIYVELKVPFNPSKTPDYSTGWLDVVKEYFSTENLNNDGSGLASSDSITQNITNGTSSIGLEFQGKGIYNNEYFVVKISAHKDWTGHLTGVRMVYS